jgi:hypothetical protein
MNSVKEEATKTLQHLPDDATWDDVLYAMYVRHGIAQVKPISRRAERIRLRKS